METIRIQEQGRMNREIALSYDKLMRGLMLKGYLTTGTILNNGILEGMALEIGPGPGYLGLEWLSNTTYSHLTGIDISEDMITLARQNAAEFGLDDRAKYFLGDAQRMPFEDETFDAVFSNGSLHEWENPDAVLAEIYRVLKPGGTYCITDLRRDMSGIGRKLLQFLIPRERRGGLSMAIQAAYTVPEVKELTAHSPLKNARVSRQLMSLTMTGSKPGKNIYC